MSFRKALFWLHLSMGIIAGTVILILSVTGVVLAFQRQIVGAVDRRRTSSVAFPPEPHQVSADAILAEASRTTGACPAALTISRDPSSAVKVDLGDQRTLYVNPYTGAVLGEGSQGIRRFFRTTAELHRWLAASASWRDTGKAIIGASNLLFFLLLCSGLYLWVPRRWSWGAARRSALFRSEFGGRARFWNWHNVVGIWCAIPLLLITVSGVVMSYRWANDAVYRLLGNQPPAPPQPGGPPIAQAEAPQGHSGGHGAGAASQAASPGSPASLDLLLRNAQGEAQDWQSITLQISSASQSPSAIVLTSSEGRPDKRLQLTFDGIVLAIRRLQRFRARGRAHCVEEPAEVNVA
jgi:uncharacterized iron-regulated membrane protein